MRRLTLRATGLLAVALAAITCTDATTAPGTRAPAPARLGLAPSLSPAAARANTVLADAGVSVAQVRIVLRNAEGLVVKDTVIDFPATQDTLSVELPLQIQGTEQSFTATLDLRDANGVVLFSQTQVVTARAASLPAATPPVIVLEYVGPGAAARAVAISPTDVTIAPNTLLALVASATDSAGGNIPDLIVGWTSSDTSIAKITTTGRATATIAATGRRGPVTVTATTPSGVVGTAHFTALPQAARLVVVSGDAQTAVAGRALAQPLVLELQGLDGGPIPNAAVVVKAVTAGASVGTLPADTLVTTDNLGRASVRLTVGQVAGTYTFQGRSGTLLAPAVSATATPGAPAKLAWLDVPQDTIVVGGTFAPVSARLADGFGNAVHIAGVKVLVRGQSPDSSGYADSTVTDTAGVARVALGGYKGVAGRLVLTLSSAGLDSVVHQITAVSGAAAQLHVVSGVPTTAASGVAFAQPVVLQVTDVGGNAVAAAATVTASVTGGATLSGTTSVATTADGRATLTGLTMSGVAGSYQLRFDAAGLTGVITPPVALTGGVASSLTITAGDGQAGTVGSTLAVHPTVRVADVNGNPVRSGRVVFAPLNGSRVSPDTVVLDANGTAGTQWTLGAVAGADTLVARLEGSTVAPATFVATATAGAAARLAIAGTSPTSASSGAALSPQPVLQLRDTLGNDAALAGVTVTATVASGSATLSNATAITNASGTATFAGLTLSGPAGSVTLAYSATGYASATSAPISVGAGAPGQLALRTVPSATAASGMAFAQAPVVQLEDAAGNTVSAPGVAVTASITSGSGTLLGTTTVNTSALGQASFDGLGITGAAGAYTLSFGASGLTPVTASVTVTAGTPASVTAVAGDAQAGGLGGVAPVAPKVVVRDASSNPVAGVSVTFTAVSVGDSVSNGTLGRTASVVTDAAGEAALTAWKLGTTGFDTVTANVGTLSARFTATATLGAATHFVVVSGGGQTGVVTDSLPQLVVVEARDANEQPVPNTPAKFNYSFTTDQGFIHVVGTCEGDCVRTDSVNTDASGRASFAWHLSYHAKVDSVVVENDEVPALLITATAVAGPPELLVFDAPNGLDDDAGNVLSPFRVIVSDRGGYDTLAVSGHVTLDLRQNQPPLQCDGTCPPPPTPSGTVTVPVVNGVATFSDISIPTPAYSLYFVASYDAAPAASGSSDLFDISSSVPQFVVVSGDGQTALANTNIQVTIRSQTGSGRAVANVPIIVDGSYGYGSWSLAGGSYPGGTRDSATTDANGLIVLTWHLPSQPIASMSISAHNYDGAYAYISASSVIGAPAKLVPTSGPLDDDAGSPLGPIDVYVTDSAGNHVGSYAGNINVTLQNNGVGATLGGTTTRSIGDGLSIFDDLTIDKVGTGFTLRFTTDDGKLLGETAPFDISVPPAPVLTSLQVSGSNQLLLTPTKQGVITFVARDQFEAPMAGQSVRVSSSAATCTFEGASSTTVTTDANGQAAVTVTAAQAIGGCHLDATAGSLGAVVQGAVYDGTATHVWFGNGSQPGVFGDATNWLHVTDQQHVVPASGDRLYVPAWVDHMPDNTNGPDRDFLSVEMQNASAIFLGGTTFTFTDGIAASSQGVVGGTVVAGGTGTSVSGTFSTLVLGRTGACATDSVSVQNVDVQVSLVARCTATLGSGVVAERGFVGEDGSRVHMISGTSNVSVGSDGLSTVGELFETRGRVTVGGDAKLAPKTLDVGAGVVQVGGNADFGAAGNTMSFGRGATVRVTGTASFLGGGTVDADTVAIHGDANFVGDALTFRRGSLFVDGNFTQKASTSAASFVSSLDHLTVFQGGATQVVSLESSGAEPQSGFGRVSVRNTKGEVVFASSVGFIPATAGDTVLLRVDDGAVLRTQKGVTLQGLVEIGTGLSGSSGVLTIDAGSAFQIFSPSYLHLFPKATLEVNGTLSASCIESDTSTTIKGTGLMNDKAPDAGSCSPPA